MPESMPFTFQTRIQVSAETSEVLNDYARHYQALERKLYTRLRAGHAVKDLKREFIANHDITARQFNAIRVELEGKLDSLRKLASIHVSDIKARIKDLKAWIKKAEKQIVKPGVDENQVEKKRFALHQKKRRLNRFELKCREIESRLDSDKLKICFGSRKLFRAQFQLAENGFESHQDWKQAWDNARSNQFFVLGSKDETAGCQGCQAVPQDDNSFTVKLRIPDALGAGKTVVIPGVIFSYGHDKIMAALVSGCRIEAMTKAGKPCVRRTGTAISYRFLRDRKGWRIFASVAVQAPEQISEVRAGAIGIDLNADHLAMSEVDRFGNPVLTKRVDINCYGKTQNQATAIIGDAVQVVVQHAIKTSRPVVIESLDFTKRRAELGSDNPKQARMLSSFSYNKIQSMLRAACFRAGIEIVSVNPAYTSTIGAVNYAQRLGISVHCGAAIAIARRGLGFSENPPKRRVFVPAHKSGHVTFDLPVRNRSKHVWSYWAEIRKRLRAAHVAQARCNVLPSSLQILRELYADRAFYVKPIEANRIQHCSGYVMDDIPW